LQGGDDRGIQFVRAAIVTWTAELYSAELVCVVRFAILGAISELATQFEPIERISRLDTKIAIALDGRLPVWQKLNVTAFLASGIAATAAESIGERYRDADGTDYTPMFGQPVMVFSADRAPLERTLYRAVNRGVSPAIFTAALFGTGTMTRTAPPWRQSGEPSWTSSD
jgi:hypothetical protein